MNAEQSVELWSPDDIREDSPEDASRITDDQIGILFHSGDGDGALIIGTEEQVITRMEQVIALVRRERAILDGDVIDAEEAPDALPGARIALPAGPAGSEG